MDELVLSPAEIQKIEARDSIFAVHLLAKLFGNIDDAGNVIETQEHAGDFKEP
jgi:hypothetical protein